MSESSEVVGGGTSASPAVVAAPDASAYASLVEVGVGGTAPEGSTLALI